MARGGINRADVSSIFNGITVQFVNLEKYVVRFYRLDSIRLQIACLNRNYLKEMRVLNIE